MNKEILNPFPNTNETKISGNEQCHFEMTLSVLNIVWAGIYLITLKKMSKYHESKCLFAFHK